MSAKSIAARFWDLDMRIESMFYLPGVAYCDTTTSEYDDAMEDSVFGFSLEDFDEEVTRLFPTMPKGLREALRDSWDIDEFNSWLRRSGEGGFLVQFATPERRYVTPTMCSSSWGIYYTKWFHADTMAKVMREAIKWAEELDKEARAQAEKE